MRFVMVIAILFLGVAVYFGGHAIESASESWSDARIAQAQSVTDVAQINADLQRDLYELTIKFENEKFRNKMLLDSVDYGRSITSIILIIVVLAVIGAILWLLISLNKTKQPGNWGYDPQPQLTAEPDQREWAPVQTRFKDRDTGAPWLPPVFGSLNVSLRDIQVLKQWYSGSPRGGEVDELSRFPAHLVTDRTMTAIFEEWNGVRNFYQFKDFIDLWIRNSTTDNRSYSVAWG